MKKIAHIVVLLLCALSGCGREKADKVISVSAKDAEMNAAIEKARSMLPHFWSEWAKHNNERGDFCLKVKIEDEHGTEHFWCIDIYKSGEKITGVINNDPDIVRCVKIGQRFTIREDQISDWLYMKDGKMIGNYTLRPLMRTMRPEERAAMVARLGDLP